MRKTKDHERNEMIEKNERITCSSLSWWLKV